MRYGSLFAGIGGIDLGLDRAGLNCAWQVEMDNYARKVLQKHWPDVERFRDVRQCGKHNLSKVELVAGGFPCQDISHAGHGAGIEAERSGLFFEALRVVHELQPKYVLLENVAALLTRGLDRVLGELGQIGYDAEWHCIPAAAFGAPHIRDRVFVLAYPDANGSGKRCDDTHNKRRETRDDWPTVLSSGRDSARANIESTGEIPQPSSGRRQRRSKSKPGNETKSPQQDCKPSRSSAGNGASNWWATEPDVGRVADGVPKRLDRLRGLGNAVVPQVAEWIGRQILDHHEASV